MTNLSNYNMQILVICILKGKPPNLMTINLLYDIDKLFSYTLVNSIEIVIKFKYIQVFQLTS